MIDLRAATLLDGIPQVLRDQPWAAAISYAFSRQMTAVLEALPSTHSWTALDTAPDAVLDQLAVEMHAHGYDQQYPADRKREIIRASFDYWAHAGTVASIADVLASTFGAAAQIEDWYMYEGGQPGYFQISTDDPDISGSALSDFRRLAEQVKRLSAWLDKVSVTAALPSTYLRLAHILLRASEAELSTAAVAPQMDAPEGRGYAGARMERGVKITLSTAAPENE